ncbi:DUF6879 family protein [Streptomyces sedi]|uniref:DUF6879 domain-containing protein n=1 Tax=Streptomyces sedi TaxID=555059 RepID=A0A5C4V9H4_9ACTN|nr:DUF6879 family protein [Streptomyces sedi]TNM32205.1 hypothetical protein FH715_07340 [Streptomyces sedi]
MSDLRAPFLADETGTLLTRSEFRQDFRERRAVVRGADSFKLERLQHFEEVDDPSRDALRRGDWQEALRLFESERESARRAAEEQAARGAVRHRVRVVEQPVTPYVQWELHWLRMRAESGHSVRVLPASEIAFDEAAAGRPLPELVSLGDRTLFRVRYDDRGRPAGAVRFTDRETVRRWGAHLRELFTAAEDVRTFFAREVAHLAPPPPA